MKIFFKIVSNILIILLIFIIVFFTYKSFNNLYNITYTSSTKKHIDEFILRSNAKLKNKKNITNITMKHIIPSGCAYTIYYIDTNNDLQQEKFSRKSDKIFEDYIIKNGENPTVKYINISKTAIYLLLSIILIKAIIVRITNK